MSLLRFWVWEPFSCVALYAESEKEAVLFDIIFNFIVMYVRSTELHLTTFARLLIAYV